ncbi:ABC transporter ATP-binding protein [Vagococcus silagei]|uniref:ABC transporter ATP-binding protein n=1 Tax=Vagococcus silagei TaxID=2508885 RepID=A0A4S3B2U8_9ENTE|nr:ABC transporter ATP-binding protein [Vagococcus silagei]THB60738.1 ABC transporter ATP-binding protein [Vagococcus silagei]
MIKMTNIVKRYDELTALNHFNLEVKSGEILGLVGPNGCGKSTAIFSMLALLKIDRGEIELFGEPMTPTSYHLKQKIGIVPQELAFFEELTVKQNIDYFCGLYISQKEQRETLVQTAIELVGLEDFIKFYPKQLSGGLKRRLNIACGIAHQPELIILDEPTVAVDPQSRNKILESIRSLNNQGATIVYTSHYLEEVESLCETIVIMDSGQVIAEGSSEALKAMVRTEEKLMLDVPFVTSEQLSVLETLSDVQSVNYDHETLTIHTTKLSQNLLTILETLKEEKIHYANLRTQEITLNDVFLAITGKELRDK